MSAALTPWPPRIGKPATRALTEAEITSREKLCQWTEARILALHGVGPKAVNILRDDLHEAGLDFSRLR